MKGREGTRWISLRMKERNPRNSVSTEQFGQTLLVHDGYRSAIHPNEAVVPELPYGGADRFAAAADEVGHFLVGQRDLEPNSLLVCDSFGLAQI